MGKNLTRKRETESSWEEYQGRNRERERKIWGRNQDLNKLGWGRIWSCMELFTTLNCMVTSGALTFSAALASAQLTISPAVRPPLYSSASEKQQDFIGCSSSGDGKKTGGLVAELKIGRYSQTIFRGS